MKRINVCRVLSVVKLNHEMPGQPDSENRHAEPPRDFHVHHRKRHRNSSPAFQNLVQTTVQRIEIIFFVPVEAKLLKEIPLGGLDEITAIVEVAEPVAQM